MIHQIHRPVRIGLILILLTSSYFLSLSAKSNLALNPNSDFEGNSTVSYSAICEPVDTNMQKIDADLQNLLQSSSDYNEKVNIYITYITKCRQISQLPPNIIIKQQFSIIPCQLIQTSLQTILELAEYSDITSITLDQPYGLIDKNTHTSFGITPNDSSTSGDFVNYTKEVHATDLWEQNYTGEDVVIAILDTGVDISGGAGGNLDDFDDESSRTKFLGGVSMVPDEPLYYSDLSGRGTYHAGIACGTGFLNSSYSGIAPDAYYLNVKVYDSLGLTYWSFIISGIEWAVSHGADIILFPHTIPGLYLDPVCRAVDTAVERGVFVVAPTGDDGPSYMSINTPGQASKACTVGAYNSYLGEVWEKSSRGPSFDFSVGPNIIAPGVNIIGPRSQILSSQSLQNVAKLVSNADIPEEMLDLFWENYQKSLESVENLEDVIPKTAFGETLPYNENYTISSGTGAAAAIIAGCVAILISAFPLANPILLQQALMQSATPLTGDVNAEGSGLVNIEAAFNWLNEYFTPNAENLQPTSTPLLYSGFISNKNVSIYGDENKPLNYSDAGEQDFSITFSTQAMMDAVFLSNSSTLQNETESAANYTSFLLPLNQFGLSFQLEGQNQSEFHWFSEFEVVREMHECVNYLYYEEIYHRYSGILKIQDLYTVVNVETWAYSGDYLNETEPLNITNPLTNDTIDTNYEYHPLVNATRVNSAKISFNFINDRDDLQNYYNLSLISYFKADMFLNEFSSLGSETVSENALNFTLDDTVSYNAEEQLLFVSDANNNTNYLSENKEMAMGFKSLSHNLSAYAISESIELLLDITQNVENADNWNYELNGNSNHSGEGETDFGFASAYFLGDALINTPLSFNGCVSLGMSNTSEGAISSMIQQASFLQNNVTQYEVVDLIIIETDTPRVIKNTEKWTSSVKILNIGNTALPKTELAFVVNRSTNTGDLEIYSIIYKLNTIQPNQIMKYNASWVPLYTGVFTVGWILGDSTEIMQSIDNYYGNTNFDTIEQDELKFVDVCVLSNIMYRSLYVIDKRFYEVNKYEFFHVFPNLLDQEPMKLYVPLDYGIYNLTVYTSSIIKDVQISTDGLGKNDLFFLDLSPNNENPISSVIQRDLDAYSSIPLVLFANPLTPPGIVSFNITFRAANSLQPFYKLPVELYIVSNRGRIWFDATHLNFFTSSNLVGSGALSGIFENGTLPQNSIQGGNFGDLSNTSLDASDGFDVSQFIDLEERLDTTWGAFNDFRKIWSEPTAFFDKGASVNTIIPFISLNLTEYFDFNALLFENSTTDSNLGTIPSMTWNNFSTSELIPETSFLANTLGNYSFNSEIQTTNYINHDLLQFFDGIVINDPEQGFLDREIEDITKWTREGGTVFVFAEDALHNNLSSLNQLLQEFQLQISNTSFYPYSEYEPFPDEDGYYHLFLQDKVNKAQLFTAEGGNINELMLKDPLAITSLDGENSTYILGKGFRDDGAIGVSFYGKGQVIVIGDNDIFKNSLIDKADNAQFAQQILRWGLRDYYQVDIDISSNVIEKSKASFIDLEIENYEEVQAKGLLDRGLLFVSTFFFENGSMINAQLYGIDTPILPVFESQDGHYSIWLDSNWYESLGTWYILIILDHPAGTSELIYVKITVIAEELDSSIEYWEQLTPGYPHYIDIIAIISILFFSLFLWYYDAEKYKTRLRITQLQGDYLNIAKTKLNEVSTQLKLLLRGVEKGDITEIERMRFLLSNQKQLVKFFKDLKKFGESIGEHY